MKLIVGLVLALVVPALAEFPIQSTCNEMCRKCDHLSEFLDLRTCPNCPCMSKMFEKETQQKCDEIDRSVHCPYGLELNNNGCPTGKCRRVPESCPVYPLKGCQLVCDKGYTTDSNGCPECECQCDNEGIDKAEVVKKCRERCHPFRFQINMDTTGCDNCFCEKKGKQPKLCNGDDRTLQCRNNCGRWGFKGGCKGDPCECQCPNPGLTCDHVLCANDRRPTLVNDTIGCRLACECPRDATRPTSPLINPELCPQVKCPSDCGQHELIEERDENGCVRRCTCKCQNPGCVLPCMNGALTDMYNCPTCQCRIQDQCPMKCNNTCGPYDYAVPRDIDGCLSDCSCRCPNHPICPRNCKVTDIEHDRYGCERCVCKDLRCGPPCPIDCGPHGFRLDMDGCPLCECNCPEQITCPRCPGQGQNFLKDTFGCKTCQCECPPRKCPQDICPQGFALDINGCETCSCRMPPSIHNLVGHSESDKNTCNKLDCAPCSSSIRGLDRNGCETCTCCPSIDCPLKCPLKTNKLGCPICECG